MIRALGGEKFKMDSILTSVKKIIGISEEDESFDTDLIIHINSVLMILNQLGVGPEDGFSITDKSAVWTDLIGDNKLIEAVKTFVGLKVRLIFDPPTSSAVLDSINKTISELEWRINVMVENKANVSGGEEIG